MAKMVERKLLVGQITHYFSKINVVTALRYDGAYNIMDED